MQTEPPKAEPPKRKRRWFQFRLMLAILLMTLASVIAATIQQWREGARFDYERVHGGPSEPRGVSPLKESGLQP